MQPLNFEFNTRFHDLDDLDVPLHLPTHPLKHTQALSIAPWDDSEASHAILGRFENHATFCKNTPQYSDHLKTLDEHEHNFINSSSKERKNRSDLGKLRKKIDQNKGQNYHLNLNKIEFLQYQKNQSHPLYHKSLALNPKSNVKNFSSIQNNFFIKSYFFPNNPKMTKKEESMPLESRKQKEYKKIKQIKGPSFIAIKSVDLKQKVPMQNEEESDSDTSVDPQTERFYSAFRTISLLGSRKERRNRNLSIQENYNPTIEVEDQTQKYKTIESTKESLKEMSETVQEKMTLNLDKKLLYRISQSSKNPVIVGTANSSFTRKKDSIKSVKMNLSSSKLDDLDNKNEDQEAKNSKVSENMSQNGQGMQVTCIKKQLAIKKEKASRISVLNELKQKNDVSRTIQGLGQLSQEISPLSRSSPLKLETPKKQQCFAEKRGERNSKQFHFGTRIRKQLNNSSLNKTLRIFDKMHIMDKSNL